MRIGIAVSLVCVCVCVCVCAQALAALSPTGLIPAEPQRPGDPVAGHATLLNQPYVTCGIPYDAYLRSGGAQDSENLPGRIGRNNELPYTLTSHTTSAGVELVVSNCLSCHVAKFNDQIIIGLGNETLDWTEDLEVMAESIGAYVEGDAAAAEWRRWADRVSTIAPYMLTDTVGVNPANNLTLALIAHRDPQTLAWSDEPLIEPPPESPLPVSVPPWWRMAKKNAMFYSGEGRGDHARIMMTAAILCTDDVAEARAIDAWAPDIRAYIASIEPPVYPYPIDRSLAQQGRGVFAANCSRCHGHYGSQPNYPNLVVALAEIGTDPELARAAGENGQRFITWYAQSFFGELARAAPAAGYVAPPLDGVWATAPYLHNGSVPSIATLLESSQRPKFWRRRSLASTDFDQRALGWNFDTLATGKDGATDWNEAKLIYDTTQLGFANTGHLFGDHLTGAERRAVLEYLKTL